ncbi:MAG: methionine gamma-lyase family protein [Firmicutes bacterium]|nr:methionine gamma-lyase family protein [Bacillota bacterium]
MPDIVEVIMNINQLIENSEKSLTETFKKIDSVALYNQEKVLSAFKRERIALRHFAGTTGYGYDDIGRDTLGKLYADVFHTESAIVSPLIANGTHAISIVLFGLLRPGDIMYSISGDPYDTLMDVIGGNDMGSLKEYGVRFDKTELSSGDFDKQAIAEYLGKNSPKIIFIQRSRGYSSRDAFTVEKLGEIISFVHRYNNSAAIVVDNCYGEFVETKEPTDVGADIVVGSLIKNPGGGLAPTGGYIAGKED